MNNKIQCNECGNKFVISKILKRKVETDNTTERNYFKCPECGCEYTAYYTNKAIRDRIRKIRDFDTIVKVKASKQQYIKELKEEKKLIELNKKDMAQLRKKFDGWGYKKV